MAILSPIKPRASISLLFPIEAEQVIGHISSCEYIYFLHLDSNHTGFSLRNESESEIYEILCDVVTIFSGPNPPRETTSWTFKNIKENDIFIVDKAGINPILGFIEDKFGKSIEELSLGYISYEP